MIRPEGARRYPMQWGRGVRGSTLGFLQPLPRHRLDDRRAVGTGTYESVIPSSAWWLTILEQG